MKDFYGNGRGMAFLKRLLQNLKKYLLSLKPRRVYSCRSMAAARPLPFVLTQKEAKSQGCIPLCYLASKSLNDFELTAFKHKIILYGSSSARQRSRNARPFFQGSACCSAEAEKNDLLVYGVLVPIYRERGRGATAVISDQIAGCKSSKLLGRDSGTETSEDAVVAKRSRFEHRLISLDFCAPLYQDKTSKRFLSAIEKQIIDEKRARLSADEDGKDVGGKGTCVPHVETQYIASLRNTTSARRQRSKHSSTVQRGEVGIPRSVQVYLQMWLSGMLAIENKAHGLRHIAYSLIFVSLLFSLEAQAQSRQDVGAANGKEPHAPVHWAGKAAEHPWYQYIHCHLHDWRDSGIKMPKDPAADLDRFPLYTYKIDLEQIGTIAVGENLPDDLLDFPLTVLDQAGIVTFTTLRELSATKYLVLDFWAAWCAPCLYSMIKWEELRNDIENDITVVGIHLDADYKADIQLRKRNWKSTQVIGAGAWLINSMFCNGTVVGPSAWIRDGRLFGFSKAGAVGTDYIFQLIKDEITSIPDSVQWNPVGI